MADEQHVPAETLVAHGLLVDFRDERAGRIKIEEMTRLGVGGHRLRHTVGGKHDRGMAMLGRDLVEFLDEHRTELLQPLDDIAVVDDLVADIDRRAILLQRQNDDLDGAVDTGAEAARLAEPDRQGRSGRRFRHGIPGADGPQMRPRPATVKGEGGDGRG